MFNYELSRYAPRDCDTRTHRHVIAGIHMAVQTLSLFTEVRSVRLEASSSYLRSCLYERLYLSTQEANRRLDSAIYSIPMGYGKNKLFNYLLWRHTKHSNGFYMKCFFHFVVDVSRHPNNFSLNTLGFLTSVNVWQVKSFCRNRVRKLQALS